VWLDCAMMNRPCTPTFQTGVIRHVSKATSPYFAQRRHSTTTSAYVHNGRAIARDCAHHFIHDRSTIGRTFANARFACLNRFEFTSIRRFASAEGAGTGKAPAGTAFEMQEAARKHREIQQSLLRQDPPSASAQPSPTSISSMAGKESNLAFLHELREQQREQKRRQAIINSALSFLMVVLAAQGAKNGQERRHAQAGRDQAEQELLQIRSDLRNVIESDESLERLARECIEAFDDSNARNDGRAWWSGWTFAILSNVPANEDHEARVHRVVKALRQGLASQLTSVMLSDGEKERQEMEQLARIAASALSFPDATTPNAATTPDAPSNGLASWPASSPAEEASTRTGRVPIEVLAGEQSATSGNVAPKKVFMF
jgi:hypothetical protein